jgi:hypothetical protein
MGAAIAPAAAQVGAGAAAGSILGPAGAIAGAAGGLISAFSSYMGPSIPVRQCRSGPERRVCAS